MNTSYVINGVSSGCCAFFLHNSVICLMTQVISVSCLADGVTLVYCIRGISCPKVVVLGQLENVSHPWSSCRQVVVSKIRTVEHRPKNV